MNSDFPRILSLLRKEKGISQKNAAKELGISQSLLSHYEKGIRECGLAFVVKAANFYNVSCDYLLGRSPARKGTTITTDELKNNDNENKKTNPQMLKILYRQKILVCSLNIILNLLTKTKNSKLIDEIFNFLSFSIYNTFRIIFRINKKNNKEMFVLNDNVANQLSLSEMIKSDCKANLIAKSETDKEDLLKITNQTLEQNWPTNFNALLNLIKNCENNINQH